MDLWPTSLRGLTTVCGKPFIVEAVVANAAVTQ